MKTQIGTLCLMTLIATGAFAQTAASTNSTVKASEPASRAPASANAPESVLLGQWNVSLGSYRDTWTFNADGTMASANQPDLRGTWKKETNCVLIQWDEVEDGSRTWEAFTLPLREGGTRGGNWRGMRLLATKIKS
jgi:hypothetical protein